MGGRTAPRIEIGVEQIDGERAIFVRDNGIGIKQEYQKRVFGLFDKLDAKTNGSGVGLALVKRIIEVHNGKIWLHSNGEGRGSTFYFILPQNGKTGDNLYYEERYDTFNNIISGG